MVILLFVSLHSPPVLRPELGYSFCNLLLGKLSNSKLKQLFESGHCSLMTLIGWKENSLLQGFLFCFGFLELPDVWQIFNKRSLWFGVSGSDQSSHHQTLRERWWNRRWLRGVECRPAGMSNPGCWQSGSSEIQIKKEETLVLMPHRCSPCSALWFAHSSFYIIPALGSDQVWLRKYELLELRKTLSV